MTERSQPDTRAKPRRRRKGLAKQVVRSPLEVSVTDSVASVGGVAMLRCLVPPAAREYVSLTAWVSDDDVTVLPSTDVSSNRSRFQAFSSGLLVVNGVTRNDERRRFRCVVKDSLTGEKVESGIWGKFVVTETKGHSAPQLLEYEGRVRVREGTLAKIPCAATGNPPPNYRWYKLTGSQIHPVVLSHKVQEVDGTLLFRRASLHDSGKYVCIANNSLGQDRTDRELIVTDGEGSTGVAARLKTFLQFSEGLVSRSTGPSLRLARGLAGLLVEEEVAFRLRVRCAARCVTKADPRRQCKCFTSRETYTSTG
ncbi:hypothetical protein MTO96_013637 [Rhipicephalus appendiculatus]